MRRCILILLVATACNSKDKEATPPPPTPQPVPGAKYTTVTAQALDGVIHAYDGLLTAFAKGDTAAVGVSGRALSRAMDSLSFNDFKTDTLVYQTAMGKMSDTHTELKGLLGEVTLAGRRQELNMVSQDLYDLLRTIGYNGKILYFTECATALGDDRAGDWISPTSDSTTASNPYTGGAGCAQVKDSIGNAHH